MKDDYEFQQLHEDQIRLITLAPALHFEDEIQCLITHYRRDERPGYDAISYCWGVDPESVRISCNDRNMNVISSCESALRALRHTHEPQTLWIDAICIDQSNTSEKGEQVARMGDVYANARSTFVYLGHAAKIWDIYDDESDNDHWEALLKRRWFSRTWVIQEVLLSNMLTFVIGNQRIALHDLLALCMSRRITVPALFTLRTELAHEYARRAPKSWDHDLHQDQRVAAAGSSSRSPNNGDANLISESRDDKIALGEAATEPGENGESPDSDLAVALASKGGGNTNLEYWRLLSILEQTRDFDCLDPRDKLFAILPLFRQPIPDLLRPDYDKTVERVYTDISSFLVEEGQIEAIYVANGSNALPSWVIDWRNPVTHVSLDGTAGLSGAAAQWRASWRAGIPENPPHSSTIHVDGDSLRANGIVCGDVDTVVNRYRKKISTRTSGDIPLSFHVAVTLVEEVDKGLVRGKLWCTDVDQRGLEERDHARGQIIQMLQDALGAEYQSQPVLGHQQGVVGGQSVDFSTFEISCPGTLQARKAFDRTYEVLNGFDSGEGQEVEQDDIVQIKDIVERQSKLSLGRCAVQLTDRTWCLAPKNTKPADSLCILIGLKTPFILRRAQNEYRLIGQCCAMSQLMEGANIDEAFTAEQRTGNVIQDFIVV